MVYNSIHKLYFILVDNQLPIALCYFVHKNIELCDHAARGLAYEFSRKSCNSVIDYMSTMNSAVIIQYSF